MKYVVMIKVPTRHGWGETEYTGTYYDDEESARREMEHAKKQGKTAWIEYYNYCGCIE
jgi:hypothetical protein